MFSLFRNLFAPRLLVSPDTDPVLSPFFVVKPKKSPKCGVWSQNLGNTDDTTKKWDLKKLVILGQEVSKSFFRPQNVAPPLPDTQKEECFARYPSPTRDLPGSSQEESKCKFFGKTQFNGKGSPPPIQFLCHFIFWHLPFSCRVYDKELGEDPTAPVPTLMRRKRRNQDFENPAPVWNFSNRSPYELI